MTADSAAPGGECDDGNPCTGDACVGGLCTHKPQDGTTCGTSSSECIVWRCAQTVCRKVKLTGNSCELDGNVCTRGVCSSGICGNEARADGNPCPDDGNICTDDVCFDSACTHPANSSPCPDEGDPCTDDRCADKACTHPPNTGNDCVDDGDPCTDDTCVNGSCTHPTSDCSYLEDPCTTSVYCDPLSGCQRISTCVSANPCIIAECQPSGSCVYSDRYPPPTPQESCSINGCTLGLTVNPISAIGTPNLLIVNDDDDNNNGNPDYLDVWPIQGEDDFATVDIGTAGCPPPMCAGDPRPPCWDLSAFGTTDFDMFRESTLRTPIVTSPNPEDFAYDWPPPSPVYLQGVNPSSACGTPMKIRFSCHNATSCWNQSAPIRVVKLVSLTWQKAYASNADLTRCPNNGGQRIFPDMLSPDESSADADNRREVKLVARIEPPIAGVTVWFRVFDVDDPFDQVHGPSGSGELVENVSLLDTDPLGGCDNRAGGCLGGKDTARTNAQGIAVWRGDLHVSMQPGDNYRAAASLQREVVETQINANMASALSTTNGGGNYRPNGDFSGYKVPATWSKMLTVWRRLHVETDTMVRPTFEQNTVTGNWNEPRFLGGQLWIDIPDQVNADDFDNGYIRIQAPGFADLISIIIDHDSSVLDDNIRTNINAAQWGSRPNVGSFIASDDDLNVEATFTAGVLGSDIGIGNPPTGYLPLPDTSGLVAHYKPAYILPAVEDAFTSTTGIPFVKNIENFEVAAVWEAARLMRGLPVSTPPYWTAYVYAAFQAETGEDFDGEVKATKGISTHKDVIVFGVPTTSSLGSQYTGMCSVFVEALRDGFSDQEHRITVAHEIAHTLGVDHGIELMHKTVQTNVFSSQSLKELREYAGP